MRIFSLSLSHVLPREVTTWRHIAGILRLYSLETGSYIVGIGSAAALAVLFIGNRTSETARIEQAAVLFPAGTAGGGTGAAPGPRDLPHLGGRGCGRDVAVASCHSVSFAADCFKVGGSIGVIMESATVATGTVKWFNATKGFGFIQPDGGGKDVFLHISAVERAGLTVNEGATVEYDIVSERGKESAGI